MVLVLGTRRCDSSRMVYAGCCRSLKITATVLLLLASLSTRWDCVDADGAAPVENCDKTGSRCTLTNAYAAWNDRSTCTAAAVVYPTTEEEIRRAVASAVKAKQKIKVSTASGHSIPILACPGSPTGVILSTRKYASIVNIDIEKRTVEAQGGIRLRALIDSIAKQGLALPVAPYWEGVTLAGLLATGAHGSSLFGRGGAVHEYVTSMRVVTPAGANEGFAKVRVLNLGDGDLKSAAVSLGVLGVVSTVTLQLEPAFKRNLTLEIVRGSDDGLEDEVLRIAQNVEFGDVTWYPGLRQVVYRYDDRVPVETLGEGRNNFVGFQAQQAAVSAGIRASEELADDASNRKLKCDQAFTQVSAQQLTGYGYHQNGKFFTGFPVIGHQNLMMSSGGCQNSPLPTFYCPWDRRVKGLFYADIGVALPLHNLRPFLNDVKRLRAALPNSLCDLDLYTGILIRFAKRTAGAYLGTAQDDDAALLDFAFSRGDDAKDIRLDGDVFQELEQIAIYKYNGNPHWGKGRNYLFEDVAKRYQFMSRFVDTKTRFDPDGFFSSPWSDAMLGVNNATSVVDTPGCALEGLCRCSKDEHCSPGKKSFCRRGRVYPEARVCRFEL
ncbi:hypothetical protein KC19_5G073000 [Ceratodon purpureus]|uniref:L-gulonolactone oxidase n=1 Tax=Ceratodon purpureus TaxID=3225 RepID=A0A8T0I0B2_CERPU|nr:hypothetical protein KC19_5G073000 [Ceratodon purpureus]